WGQSPFFVLQTIRGRVSSKYAFVEETDGQRCAARRIGTVRDAGVGAARAGRLRHWHPAGDRTANRTGRRDRGGLRDARPPRGQGTRALHVVGPPASAGRPRAEDLPADAGRRARPRPRDVDACAHDARLASADRAAMTARRPVPAWTRWVIGAAARPAD